MPETPVVPRLAATVLLLDGAVRPWQVLMMQRPGGAEFLPGAYVFPGGAEHPEDGSFADASRAAGIRELFEEVGILLARRPDGRTARDADCGRLRDLLASGRAWVEALSELRLSPALDRLVFLARWVTPESVPRRFDTCFYVARRPSGQTVHPQPGEVADWCWISPAAALGPDGPRLVHVTRRVLESVAGEPDAARLIARLRRRRRSAPVRPRLVRRPDGTIEIVESPHP
jgi:8-oxo-dGTP pyrophosphatase MutT (NUDIX family)